jgi:hypothetical protein
MTKNERKIPNRKKINRDLKVKIKGLSKTTLAREGYGREGRDTA